MMMSPLKVTINLAVLAIVGSSRTSAVSSGLPSFDSFIQLHGRSYQRNSAEYEMRRTIYERHVKAAKVQNSQSDRLWTAGVNKLWDWTEEEFRTLRGWDGSRRPDGNGRSAYSIMRHQAFLQQTDDLPNEKVWSNLVMAKHIKDQGSCGSCWAIAAASVLEAHNEIYNGHFRTFSAQQIVSCTPNPRQCGGSGGCGGATAELAMEWVMQNGCADETAVPYHAADEACSADSTGEQNATMKMMQILSATSSGAPRASGAASFGMTGWETLPKNKYEPLVRALAERGPVAISVAADSWSMYESGIYNGCGKDAIIDHAVTAIGYGEENGVKYWLIQNSWGDEWGEAGHIRLQRHASDEYCGMNNKPEVGVACKGETAPVPVCGMCGVLFDSVVPHFQKA